MPKYQYNVNAIVKEEGRKLVTMYVSDIIKAENMADAITLAHEDAGQTLAVEAKITSFSVYEVQQPMCGCTADEAGAPL